MENQSPEQIADSSNQAEDSNPQQDVQKVISSPASGPQMPGLPAGPQMQAGCASAGFGQPGIYQQGYAAGCGQHICQDYGYPKSIQSRNIVEFFSFFMISSSEDPSLSGHYCFALEKKDGKVHLKEQYMYMIEDDVADFVLEELQAVIEKYNLVRSNGVVDVKQGLPAELQPCCLKAVYDTGERLYFERNNHPLAPWAIEISVVLRRAFVLSGHAECATPARTRTIKRARFEFRIRHLAYRYGEIKSGGKLCLERCVYNELKNELESHKIVRIPEQYYEKLQEFVEIFHLSQLHTGQKPFDQWKFDNMRYYYFGVEYENGNRLSDYSVDPYKCCIFYSMIPELKAFLDEWIDAEDAIVECSV